jgi:putative PIN family toxin of toxin-antitoxin system
MSDIFIFDTNSLVSAALISTSVSRKALNKAIETGELAISKATFEELIEVIFRKKFDKYFPDEIERWAVVKNIELNATLFLPDIFVTDCRDPRDNKFLELAVFANATCLISGDKDLTVLHPFRKISILNAVDFINNF